MNNLDLDSLTMLPPYVLVRRLPDEVNSRYGTLKILLPETINFRNRRVEVLKVHKGIKKGGKVVPSEVKPGDLAELIIFDGDKLCSYESMDLEVCREENILAVLEEIE